MCADIDSLEFISRVEQVDYRIVSILVIFSENIILISILTAPV